MSAQIAYYNVAFSMCRPKELPAISDFMPSRMDKTPTPKTPRMTTKKRRKFIADKLRALVKLHA